jgi:beta-lactam-binding protein with PASTA domain
VISQLPLAGAVAAAGSAVALVISNGPPPPVIVPALLNLTQAAATAAITSAGLSLGTVTTAPSPVVSAGLVLMQDPAASSEVPAGTRINLTLSSGPAPVAVPNVVGQTQDAALAAIATAGLTSGTITTAPNAVIAAGLVSGQTPTAGSLAAVGTQVSIIVSSGPPSSPRIDKIIFSDGTGTRTTATFSTGSANEALLAFVASDGPSGGGQTSTVSGAGLTWTLVKRVNTQPGTSEIWRASASALLSNVTVRSTPSRTGYAQSLTVVTFADATGIGASSVAAASTGAPAVSLTTTKPGSRVFAVGNDWDRATARTPAPGQAIVHESLATVGDTFWVQQVVNPVPAAGTVVQVTDAAPTTDRWNLACVEIVR